MKTNQKKIKIIIAITISFIALLVTISTFLSINNKLSNIESATKNNHLQQKKPSIDNQSNNKNIKNSFYDWEKDQANNGSNIEQGIVSSIYQTSDGSIWIGGSNFLNDNSIYWSSGKTDGEYNFSLLQGTNSSDIEKGVVLSIYQTKDGSIWIGGYDFGNDSNNTLYWSSGKTDGEYNFSLLNDASGGSDIEQGDVYSIYQTSDGSIWIGGYSFASNKKSIYWSPEQTDGEYKFSPLNGTNSSDIQQGAVWSIYQTNDGMIWIGGYGFSSNKNSIYLSTGKIDGKYNFSLLQGNNSSDIEKGVVLSIYQTNDGSIWIGGNNFANKNSIYWSSGKTDEEYNFSLLQGTNSSDIQQGTVWLIYQTNDGTIWIGGSAFANKNSLYRSSGKINGKYNFLLLYGSNYSNIEQGVVNVMYQTNDGSIWIGGSDFANKKPLYILNHDLSGVNLIPILMVSINAIGLISIIGIVLYSKRKKIKFS